MNSFDPPKKSYGEKLYEEMYGVRKDVTETPDSQKAENKSIDKVAFVKSAFNSLSPVKEPEVAQPKRDDSNDSFFQNLGEGFEQGKKSLLGGFGYAVGEGASMLGYEDTGRKVKQGASMYMDDVPQGDDSWGQFVGSLIPSTIGTAAAIASAPVSGTLAGVLGVASMTGLGISSAGNGMMEYDYYKASKGEDGSDLAKLGVGVAYATAEIFFERFQLGKLVPGGIKGKIFKGGLKEAEGAGLELLEKYAKNNPNGYRLLLKKVKDGLTTEGLEEVGTEIAQALTEMIYQDSEDAMETLKQLPANMGQAMLGGAIMGGALGPLSYGSQVAVNRQRRKANGMVVLAQSKTDGEAYELVAPIADELNPSYRALNKNGEEVVIARSDIAQSVELSLSQFDKLLQDKLDHEQATIRNHQPKRIATYGDLEVEVVGDDGEGGFYIQMPDGSQRAVEAAELDDMVELSPEDQALAELGELSGQPPLLSEQVIDEAEVIETEEGEFYVPGQEGYAEALAKINAQKAELAEQESKGLVISVGEGKNKQGVNLVDVGKGIFNVESRGDVESDTIELVEDMNAEEVHSFTKQLEKEANPRGLEVVVEPVNPNEPFSALSIRLVPTEVIQKQEASEYRVEMEDGKVIVINPKGEKVGSQSKYYLPVITDLFEQTASEYAQLERVTDDNPNITEANYLDEIASHSENPLELAEAYLTALAEQERGKSASIKEIAIAQDLASSRIPSSDLRGHDIDSKLAYANYTTPNGTVDIAQRAEYLSDQTGQEITIDDFIEFIAINPNGPKAVLRKEDPLVTAISERFMEVTGVQIGRALAETITGNAMVSLEGQGVADTKDSALEAKFEEREAEAISKINEIKELEESEPTEAELEAIREQLRNEGVTDEEIKRIEESANELTDEEIQVIESEASPSSITKETKPKVIGNLPKDGLAVANRNPNNGDIYVGDKGWLHTHVVDEFEMYELVDNVGDLDFGFVDSEGKWYSRKEAAKYVDSKNEKLFGEDLDVISKKKAEPAKPKSELDEAFDAFAEEIGLNPDDFVEEPSKGYIVSEDKETFKVKGTGEEIGFVSHARVQRGLFDGDTLEDTMLGAKWWRSVQTFQPTKVFELTGSKTTIDSPYDIAHMMRVLETEGVENFFAVYVDAEGKVTPHHISTGSNNATVVDPKIIIAGANHFNAVKVYMVHNHPSGNMKPSAEDLKLTKRVNISLPSEISLQHIIMDTFKGEFIHFFDSDKGGNIENFDIRNRKDNSIPKGEESKFSFEVQKFSKTVYNENVNLLSPTDDLSSQETVNDPAIIAKYFTGLRYSVGDKLELILADNSMKIIAVYPMPNVDDSLAMAKFIRDVASKHDANNAFLGGRLTNYSNTTFKVLQQLTSESSVRLLDVILVDASEGNLRNFKSLANQGALNEPSTEYKNEVREPAKKVSAKQIELAETIIEKGRASGLNTFGDFANSFVESKGPKFWNAFYNNFRAAYGAALLLEGNPNNEDLNALSKATAESWISDEIKKPSEIEPKPNKEFEKTQENNSDVKGETDYEYSSTQFNLDLPEVIKFAESIPKNELYTEGEGYGIETEPHVTALYGIATSNADEVKKVVSGIGEIKIKLGDISIFENENYDVLKIDVDGVMLRVLNRKLSKELDNENSYPTYSPHVTIAYLKPGEGKKYVGDSRFADKVITLNELLLSGKDITKTPISLIKEKNSTLKDDKVKSEKDNEPTTATGLESDSRTGEATNTDVQETVQNDGGTDSSASGEGSQAIIQGGLFEQGDSSLPTRVTNVTGKPSNTKLHDEGSSTTADDTGDSKRGGRSKSSDSRGKLSSILTEGIKKVTESKKDSKPSLAEKVALQKKAESSKVIVGDIANIAETLPVLFGPQQDDVFKAETRFSQKSTPEAPTTGMLFTNATGTGKTYTGLGIAKRFAKQGKKNILIVVPSDTKAKDWIEDGENLLLPIRQLENTKDAGKKDEAVITTYANFRANEALRDRDWDLILYDESHKLMSSKGGDMTSALRQHRYVANAPSELKNKATTKIIGKSPYDEFGIEYIKELSDEEHERIVGGYNKKKEAHKKEIDALAKELYDTTKVIFLSATPFSYHFNLDYADGFLYQIGQGVENDYSGYNQGNARDKFYMENFGYRMMYNRLTQPEVEVDSSLMEREFHTKMEESGAVSSRQLDLDYDYSRDFILVDDVLGSEIDRGLDILSSEKSLLDGSEVKKYDELAEYVRKNFTWVRQNQILESIKAKKSIERIEGHIKNGRKVVVFHSYRTNDPVHPFDFSKTSFVLGDTKKLRTQAAQFMREHPELVNLDLSGLLNPVDTLKNHFGDSLVTFNGTVSKKDRKKNVDRFNDSNSGIDVIVVQMEAGKEGISMHDVMGDSPRVMMNLGLPYKPTDAIQSEGRIYRLGNKSNAIFEYLVLHLNFERSAFADKINKRVKTAENLSAGKRARNLETSFKEGYTLAQTEVPLEEQGVGGKETDFAYNEITDYERAKTYYFGRAKRNAKTKALEGKDYFATPEPIGSKMVDFLHLKSNEKALEPSAGHGAIARFFPENTNNTFIEPSWTLSTQLQLSSKGNVLNQQFEDLHSVNKFHAIAMNPPFGSGGKLAMEHIDKAFNKHLYDGGRLVAIVPQGSSMEKRLDKWLNSEDGGGKDAYITMDITMPSVTFERAGTSVNTRILVIDKVLDVNNAESIPNTRELDLSGETDINSLFDAMEDVVAPDRVVLTSPSEDAVVQAPKINTTSNSPLALDSFTHTRDGHEVLVVKMNTMLDRDTFNELKAIAKDNDGYYSRFKGSGAIPGFIFKTEADRNSFMADVASNHSELVSEIPKLKKRLTQILEPEFTKAARTKKIAKALNDKIKNWKAKEFITIAEKADDLPDWVQQEIETRDPNAMGAFIGGRAYVLAYNAKSEAEAMKTLLHETVGHMGVTGLLRQYSGNKKEFETRLETLTEQVLESFGNDPLMQKIIKSYNLDLTNKAHRLEAGQEFIAFMAENDMQPSLVNKFIELIEDILRAMGIVTGFSKSDLRNLLIDARRYVDGGGSVYNDGIMFSAFKHDDFAKPFYSQMHQVISKKLPNKGTPQSFKQAIESYQNKGEFKKEELEWSGVLEWLDTQKGKIERADVLEFVRENSVVLEEVEKGVKSKDAETRESFQRVGLTYMDFADGTNFYNEQGDVVDIEDATEEQARLMRNHRYYSDPLGLEDIEDDNSKVTKYSGYQLEGGKNYRELLITLPVDNSSSVNKYHAAKERGLHAAAARILEDAKIKDVPYKSLHWEESNVLAHIRFNEREVDGERVLFIEEIQSDWHQAGREKGYRDPLEIPTALKEHEHRIAQLEGLIVEELRSGLKIDEESAIGYSSLLKNASNAGIISEYAKRNLRRHLADKYTDELHRTVWPLVTELREIQYTSISDLYNSDKKVPTAPFKTTWHELAMKRMIRYAAEHGFDRVSWAPGEVHTERYSLGNQIDSLDYYIDVNDGNYNITAYKDDVDVVNKSLKESELASHLGKDVAERMIARQGKRETSWGGQEMNEETGEMLTDGYKVDVYTLEGLDLEIGGEGMKGFYDKMLPSFTKKYIKKWGSKVEVSDIDAGSGVKKEVPLGKMSVKAQMENGNNLAWATVTNKSELEAWINKIDDARKELESRYGSDYSSDKQINYNAWYDDFNGRDHIKGKEAILNAFDTITITVIEDDVNKQSAWSFAVTPEMKASAMRVGQALFKVNSYEGLDYNADEGPNSEKFKRWFGDYEVAKKYRNAYSIKDPKRIFLKHFKKGDSFVGVDGETIVFESVDGREVKVTVNGKKETLSRSDFDYQYTGAPSIGASLQLDNISKVVDENGNPLVVYHGTNNKFTEFDGASFFAEDSSFAEDYGEVGAYYLNIKNPFDILNEEHFNELLNDQGPLVSPWYEEGQEDVYPEFYNSFEEFSNSVENTWEIVEPYIREIKKLGFDGAIINESGAKNYITFEPNQIKSATGNNGDYDPRNPNILFKKPLHPLNASKHPYQKKGDGAIRNLQDRFIDAKRIIKGVTSEGGKLSDKGDFYTREALHYGKVEAKREDFERTMSKPFIKDMKALNKSKKATYADLREFLYAKHAPFRNEEYYKRNPDKGKKQSGITDVEAKEMMDALKAKGIYDDLNRIAETHIEPMIQFILDERVSSGLMTGERYGMLKKKKDFYVPLRGFEEYMDIDPTLYSGDLKAEGRSSKAGDIVSYIYAMADTAIVSGEKNRVKQSLLEFVKDNIDRTDLFSIKNVFFKETGEIKDGKKVHVPVLNPSQQDIIDGKVKHRIDPLLDSANPFAEDQLVVMHKGRPVVIEFPTKHLANAFNAIDVDHIPKAVGFINRYMNFLRSVITQYSPEFALRNIIRDSTTGLINIGIDFDGVMAAKIVNPITIAKGFGALRNYYRKGEFKGEWGEAMQSFRESGGISGWWNLNTVQERTKELKGAIDSGSFGENWFKNGKKGVKSLFDFMDDYNRVLENVVRLSAFKHLLDNKVINKATGKAYTEQQAADYAKNITVNFNRKGNYGNTIGAGYLFFNASLQGMARQFQPFLSGDTRTQLRASAAPLIMAGSAYALIELIRQSMGTDDDDEYYYDKIPEYVRTHNIIVPNLLSSDPADYIKIPLPYGYNVYWAAGDVYNRVENKIIDVETAALEMAVSSIDAFNPIGTGAGDTWGQAAYKTALPTILLPGYEMSINQDFAGRPIKPEPFPFAPETPKSQQYFKYVGTLSKSVAETLNSISGGDKVVPGMVDISPEHIEYLVEYFGGGSAKFLNGLVATGQNVYDQMSGVTELTNDDIYDVPFARTLYGRVTNNSDRSLFIKNSKEVEQQVANYNRYMDVDGYKKANEYYKKNESIISLAVELKAFNKQLRVLRKAMDRYSSIDTKESRDLQKQVNTRQYELMKAFNKLYNERNRRAKSGKLSDIIK